MPGADITSSDRINHMNAACTCHLALGTLQKPLKEDFNVMERHGGRYGRS